MESSRPLAWIAQIWMTLTFKTQCLATLSLVVSDFLLSHWFIFHVAHFFFFPRSRTHALTRFSFVCVCVCVRVRVCVRVCSSSFFVCLFVHVLASPNIVIDDGNMFINVPEDKQIFFQYGHDVVSVKSLRDELSEHLRRTAIHWHCHATHPLSPPPTPLLQPTHTLHSSVCRLLHTCVCSQRGGSR